MKEFDKDRRVRGGEGPPLTSTEASAAITLGLVASLITDDQFKFMRAKSVFKKIENSAIWGGGFMIAAWAWHELTSLFQKGANGKATIKSGKLTRQFPTDFDNTSHSLIKENKTEQQRIWSEQISEKSTNHNRTH